MNVKLFLICLLLSVTVPAFAQSIGTLQKVREKQLKIQNKPEFLDFKRMEEELRNQTKDDKPLTYGIFPYPVYDSIQKDGFRGAGTYGNFFGLDLKGKKIVYSSFGEKRSDLNSHKVKDQDRIFFTILVLTDFIDTKEYTSNKTQIVSRNFPDMIGQGFIKTSRNKIDFTAFTTLENDDFAIVNMKLYHLKYGNVILIAPQKDGSLRSMQISSRPDLTAETLKQFVQQLILKPEITDFFINENTI
ncbi:hypothetical protein [Chryseobacterium sp. 22458]|uniref:hypothetical protein n=1 Tax=Chryseobacterium sp. 22458 TaxID=3453921 RepID=UPI003F841382